MPLSFSPRSDDEILNESDDEEELSDEAALPNILDVTTGYFQLSLDELRT